MLAVGLPVHSVFAEHSDKHISRASQLKPHTREVNREIWLGWKGLGRIDRRALCVFTYARLVFNAAIIFVTGIVITKRQ